MKNSTKLLALLLSVIMLMTVIPATAFAAEDQVKILKNIFDDNAAAGTSIGSWGVAENTVVDKTFKKEGEASMKISYAPDSGQSTSAMFFTPNLNLTEELRETGVLQFWYYSDVSLPKFYLGLTNQLPGGDQSESRLYANNTYLSDVTGEWTLVQIPLKDFPEQGQRWDNTKSAFVDADFDFAKIDKLAIYGQTKGLSEKAVVYIDSMAIVDASTITKPEVQATSYYVSPNGSDANDGKSPEKPLKTPQRAAEKTKPGDTVYFMGGTYDNNGEGGLLTIKNSGTPEAYITYTRYENETPLFKSWGNVWDTISVQASYIIIDGLKMEGLNDELTAEEGMANYEAYIKFQDTGAEYDNAALARTNTNAIAINGRIAVKEGKTPPHHVIVRNCDISKFPQGGVVTWEVDYITIENNRIYDNMWFSIYGASGISLLNSADIDDNTTDYKNIIRNNVLYGNEGFVLCQNGRKWSDGNGIIIDYNKNTGHASLAPYKGKTLIENNVIYKSGGSGILAFNSANIDIVNNTCVDNGQTPELTHWGNIMVNWCTNVKVVNNIAVATRPGTTTLKYGTKNNDIFFANNLHYSYANPEKDMSKFGMEQLTDEFDYDNIWADPKFADIENNDYHLTADSPAVDIAAVTMAPETDINGVKRPKGAAVDMGAYESDFTSANPVKDLEIDFDGYKASAVVPVEAAQSAKGKPVIDGVMDDIWVNTETFKTAKYTTGADGATATVKTMWHDDFLYAWVEVKDSQLDASNSESKPYTQDSVEFFIDEDNGNTADYDKDDAQYRVSYKGVYSGGTNADLEKFVAKAVEVDGGYIVEAAIPFRVHKPSTNKIIGFDVQVNDADPGKDATKSQAKWSDAENTTWQDTTRFGDLLLVDSFTHLESSDATIIKVSIDGEMLQFPDVVPFIFEGRTLVPLRAIFEALGATVEWDDATQTVTGTKDGNTVVLQIDNNIATKNGKSIKLDVPAMLKDDRTMVPARFIAESLGAKVEWFQARSLVLITTK